MTPDQPHALYRFYDAAGALLYVGITMNLPSRMSQHRDGKPWWSEIARIHVEHHATREEALAAERQAIVAEKPTWNIQHNAGLQAMACPACGKPSLLVPDLDRYAHLDGTRNEPCWRAMLVSPLTGPVSQPEPLLSIKCFDYGTNAGGTNFMKKIVTVEHKRLRQALSDFGNLGWRSQGEFAGVVYNLALAARYADMCDCGHLRIPHGQGFSGEDRCVAWPYRVELTDRGSVKGWYYCHCCGHQWTCNYALNPGVYS